MEQIFVERKMMISENEFLFIFSEPSYIATGLKVFSYQNVVFLCVESYTSNGLKKQNNNKVTVQIQRVQEYFNKVEL